MAADTAPLAAASASAAAGSGSTPAADLGLPVDNAIAAMASAVQRGDFAAAEAVGAAAPVSLAIPRAAVRSMQPLSAGAQAAVYAAELSGTALVGAGGEGHLSVAVKKAVIRETADLERFRREVALLARLRRHPHVAHLLGARLLPPDYWMALQLEHSNAEAQLHEAGWRPRWAALLSLGAQLASAVAALHALGYVHRDIKPANVLLNEARTHARLADLGLAALAADLAAGGGDVQGKPTGGFHKQRMVGTLQYMAPEVLLGSGPHTPASDAFALGVTLNELATGIVPFSDCTRDNPLAHTVLEMGYGRQELAAAVAAEGLRPTLRPDTPPALRALLEACWEAEPSRRPSAALLAEQLAALAAAAAETESSRAAVTQGEGSPARCMSPAGSGEVPTPEPAPGAKAGAARSVHVHTDVIMSDVEADGAASPDGVLSSPGSSGRSSPGADGGMGGATNGLPAWLAPAAALGAAASAGGSFASAQQAGGRVSSGAAAVHVGSFMTRGKRDNMEDTVVVLPDAFRGTAPAAPACTALGVFDGHRGAAAAEYLAAQLGAHLASRLAGSASGADLLAGALLDADATFRAQQDAEWAARVARMGPAAGAQPVPGATATLALVYPSAAGSAAADQQSSPQQGQLVLAVANLGDSRAVLCRDGRAVALTRDHTADLPDERERIAAAGGACSVRAGGWRVGAAGLQVTRSVGDADVKSEGVNAEAECVEVALQAGDSFLVVATDGLWDRISNDDAVGIVLDTVKHPAMCAQRLVTEALARGSADNVACLVAFFNTGGATAERVYHAGRLKYSGTAATRTAAAPMSFDELRDTY